MLKLPKKRNKKIIFWILILMPYLEKLGKLQPLRTQIFFVNE